ncbi:MAG TPA: hypothetical protein VG317_21640 [Pseudonocardiaceae bacterium]|jgi:hypothetical protein|nr:hypothetical protein [Pseudonocardiaceae bacterium]
MPLSELPHLDEQAIVSTAGVDDVWAVLTDTPDRIFAPTLMAGYARIVGCADHTASGPRPLAEGSTVPGFRVTSAIPGAELVLAGRHRFSTYALIFRLEPLDADRCRLRAESRAVFPGLAGGVYRLLVVGTGGHVLAVRWLLAGIASRSESRARNR